MEDTRISTDRGRNPLTREDVERLLGEVGGDASKLDLHSGYLPRIDLHELRLIGATLTEADLTGANLTRADLEGATLTDARLSGADLEGATLTGANLTRADLEGATLTDARLSRADLTDATLTDATLTRADLTDAVLEGATLTHARLSGADLTHARLSGATLTEADLTRATLTGADLTRATLTRATLTEADLTGARLTEADLTGADLTGARLSRGSLDDAILTGAVLTGYDLFRAEMPIPVGSTRLVLRSTVDIIPLRHLGQFLTSLNSLYVKGVLLARGDLDTFARYSLSEVESPPDVQEPVISYVSKASPLDIKIDVSLNPENAAKAITELVNTATSVDQKRKERENGLQKQADEIEFERQQSEEALAKARLERSLQAQQADEALAKARQERSVEEREAELRFREKELALERLQIENERARFALALEQSEAARKMTSEMVTLFYPGLSDDARPLVVRELLPGVLRLLNANQALQLTAELLPALPPPPDVGDQGTSQNS